MPYKGLYRYTSLEERVSIIWLWEYKFDTRTIAREIGISESTVYRWIRRWRQEGTVNTRPLSRKHRLLWLNKRKSTKDATKERNYNTAVQEDPSHLLTTCWDDQGMAKAKVNVECLLQHHDAYSAFKRYEVCDAERSRSAELCWD